VSGDALSRLLTLAFENHLITNQDIPYYANTFIDMLRIPAFSYEVPTGPLDLEDILDEIVGDAVTRGVCGETTSSRENFRTRLLGALVERPSAVSEKFWKQYEVSPSAATNWFYKYCQDIGYISRGRTARDVRWKARSAYGELDITINLSKPEKDPRDIAAALTQGHTDAYPRCQLCIENEGYAGRTDHPARQTLRIIPITVGAEKWGFQYSPYVYYNEHCIALNDRHVPMVIDGPAFHKLFDFLDLFPHYFIGSNADLPIVGGSILTHEHFQGGNYEFAMAKAPVERTFPIPSFPSVEAGTVRWPMPVIRLSAFRREALARAAVLILNSWRSWSDEEAGVLSHTGDTPHNTVTPIARRRRGRYELDLVLRNNRTSGEYPDGIFHPHPELHHIKKENIGLIEVMGLAVLPSRLKAEMDLLVSAVRDGRSLEGGEALEKHAQWASSFAGELKGRRVEEIEETVRQEIGKVFVRVLEDAGVFKRDEAGVQAFGRFTSSL